MILDRAKIVFRLPITCHDCGAVSRTEKRELDLWGVDPYEIPTICARQGIGTSFPVGWARYYGVPRDFYKCPKCVR